LRSPDSVGAGLPSCSKGHCARPPYFSPKRGMPHLSCLPYQLAGWDVDYPAPSVPHASPTPRRQAQRYASPPGEEPGRGYSAGVGIQHGRLKSLPRTGREKNTCHGAHARFVSRRGVERTLSATKITQLAASAQSCSCLCAARLASHRRGLRRVLPRNRGTYRHGEQSSACPQRAFTRSEVENSNPPSLNLHKLLGSVV